VSSVDAAQEEGSKMSLSSSDYEDIVYEVNRGVATVTLNRPRA
jgi:hypothetical protein